MDSIQVLSRRHFMQAATLLAVGVFIDREYPLPAELLGARTTVRIRFEPEPGHTAGPIFGCRILSG